MFSFQLFGGSGNKIAANVTDDQEISVITAPYPPLTDQKAQPFRQYFTDDGLPGGTSSMAVDGSIANVDYYIPAKVGEDRYITTLNFIVGYSASGQPNEWADGPALTNGIRLFYTSQRGEVDIHDGIKSNQDMFRLSFSPIAANWEVRHVNALNDYGYFISMDLTKMGLQFGIKLDADSSQKLIFRIKDNVGTSADSFNCIAYGFDRFK